VHTLTQAQSNETDGAALMTTELFPTRPTGLSVVGISEMTAIGSETDLVRGDVPPQDWRTITMPVLDQGNCQSCVTCAAYVVFRSIARIKLDNLTYDLPLSFDELWAAIGDSCDSGQSPIRVFGKTAKILNAASSEVQWGTGIPMSALGFSKKTDLLTNGPALGVVRASEDLRKGKGKGVGPNQSPAHAVAVVGFTAEVRPDGTYTDDGTWVLQNSWGRDWPAPATNGLLEIAMTAHDIHEFKFLQPRIVAMSSEEK
jgi:Papain family cysteine protease